MKRHALAASAPEWRAWMVAQGQPPYRVGQVLDWIIRRRAESFEAMSDVPKPLRHQLEAQWVVFGTRIVHHSTAPDAADKLVLACRDDRRIECVLMAESWRRTVCLSTQVGCGMGCIFCASGLSGLERNLNADEILDQALRLRNLLPPGESITHVVVMGMGEGLANLDNLILALDRLCSPDEGLGLSQRRVTISTVGLPERILQLADLGRQYHLAVSLHAPAEELRNILVPISQKTGLSAVLSAADSYFRRTGRQVTFQYVLLRGVNDRPNDARLLARLLTSRRAHVNLIPYNAVEGLPFDRPECGVVEQFAQVLRGHGVSVTVRRSKGQAVNAACGQLRRQLEGREATGPQPNLQRTRDAGRMTARTTAGS
jgi:23S rRNA (adenine2503-C2)-methyltransferase